MSIDLGRAVAVEVGDHRRRAAARAAASARQRARSRAPSRGPRADCWIRVWTGQPGQLGAVRLVGVDRAVLGRDDQLLDVVAVEVGVADRRLAAGAHPLREAGAQARVLGRGEARGGRRPGSGCPAPLTIEPHGELVLEGVRARRREGRAAGVGRRRVARERRAHLASRSIEPKSVTVLLESPSLTVSRWSAPRRRPTRASSGSCAAGREAGPGEAA